MSARPRAGSEDADSPGQCHRESPVAMGKLSPGGSVEGAGSSISNERGSGKWGDGGTDWMEISGHSTLKDTRPAEEKPRPRGAPCPRPHAPHFPTSLSCTDTPGPTCPVNIFPVG